MENRFKQLIRAGNSSHRSRWALDQKNQGKKVMGIACSYIPEEVFYAADMLHWHVNGTFSSGTHLADAYFPTHVCAYSTHVMEALLRDELDFLDGMVATDWDDDRRYLMDLARHSGKVPFVHLMGFPAKSSAVACRWLAGEIRILINAIEQAEGISITDEALWHAIDIHNQVRSLLAEVAELRKKELPPVSGEEAHGIVAAATAMPKDAFIRELSELLPYLKERETSVMDASPRILVSGDMLHDSGYLKLIEENGALVVVDDLDRGSRYFIENVDISMDDPVLALAKRYLDRPACPRMTGWEEQTRQVVNWAKDYQVEGVIEFSLLYSRPREMRIPYFRRAMQAANIPLLNLRIDYPLSAVEQLKTRIGAFIEMME